MSIPLMPSPRGKSPALGAVAGGAVGAALRALVTIGFLFYVNRWGGRWWDDTSELYVLAAVSGGIGIVVGGVAGSTCRPLLGAVIGGLLSGGSCFVLFVAPAGLALGMSHPGGFDRIETVEILGGLVAMTLAGALAGGTGAAVGAHSRPLSGDA